VIQVSSSGYVTIYKPHPAISTIVHPTTNNLAEALHHTSASLRTVGYLSRMVGFTSLPGGASSTPQPSHALTHAPELRKQIYTLIQTAQPADRHTLRIVPAARCRRECGKLGLDNYTETTIAAAVASKVSVTGGSLASEMWGRLRRRIPWLGLWDGGLTFQDDNVGRGAGG
jgi:hypothetical protein